MIWAEISVFHRIKLVIVPPPGFYVYYADKILCLYVLLLRNNMEENFILI